MQTSPAERRDHSARDDVPLLWAGRPRRGWFVRPDDIPNTLVITLGTLFLVYQRFWLELHPILSVLLIGLIGYLLIGRFAHDAAARDQITYELTPSELRSISRTVTVRTIAANQLVDIKPAWSGYTASITVPHRPEDIPAAVTNSWEQLVPASNPSRRLELIDNAPEIAALLRRNARARLDPGELV